MREVSLCFHTSNQVIYSCNNMTAFPDSMFNKTKPGLLLYRVPLQNLLRKSVNTYSHSLNPHYWGGWISHCTVLIYVAAKIYKGSRFTSAWVKRIFPLKAWAGRISSQMCTYQVIDPNKPEKNARTNDGFGTLQDSHVVRTIYYQISIIHSL